MPLKSIRAGYIHVPFSQVRDRDLMEFQEKVAVGWAKSDHKKQSAWNADFVR